MKNASSAVSQSHGNPRQADRNLRLPSRWCHWYCWLGTHGKRRNGWLRGVFLTRRANGPTSCESRSVKTGKTANDDAVRALDERFARSNRVAQHRCRPSDRPTSFTTVTRKILQAASIEPSESAFRRFLAGHTREFYEHGKYVPTVDGKGWIPAKPYSAENSVRPPLPDNAKEFHTRPPENYGTRVQRPLFLEMSFIDAAGMEKVKAQRGDLLKPGLRDVSRRENTFVKSRDLLARAQEVEARRDLCIGSHWSLRAHAMDWPLHES
jgi:hypothetical protein